MLEFTEVRDHSRGIIKGHWNGLKVWDSLSEVMCIEEQENLLM